MEACLSLYGGIEIPGRPDLDNIQKLDLLPVPMLMSMMQYGTAIDKEWFADLGLRLDEQLADLRAEICSYIPLERLEEFSKRANIDGEVMNVDSRDQLADLLFNVLGVGKGKALKTTKSGRRVSTNKRQLEQLRREHPVIPRCLLYAEVSKLKSTYTDALPNLAKYDEKTDTWRVHTEFMTTRTDTGRIASKSPNLQNVPSRTALGREIRRGFIASPGTKLVSVDFSQEELRLIAHLSRDRNMIRTFELGTDLHNETAKRIFGTDNPDYITQRTPARNCNFGIAYGLSAAGLYDLMAVTYATAELPMPDWMTVEWTEAFIRQWFELYGGVKEYLEKQHYRARRYGIVWTPFGRVRRVPEVESVHEHIQAAGLRQAGNHPVQGAGADLMRLVMGEIWEELKKLEKEGIRVKPLLTLHDELVVEVETEYAEFVRDMMIGVMMDSMRDRETGEWLLRVPLEATGKVSQVWEK